MCGSPRDYEQRCQTARACVRHFGKPSLFVTFTCNPAWPEIVRNRRCFDIHNRVFAMKLKALKADLESGVVFGSPACIVDTVEFQKRGDGPRAQGGIS